MHKGAGPRHGRVYCCFLALTKGRKASVRRGKYSGHAMPAYMTSATMTCRTTTNMFSCVPPTVEGV